MSKSVRRASASTGTNSNTNSNSNTLRRGRSISLASLVDRARERLSPVGASRPVCVLQNSLLVVCHLNFSPNATVALTGRGPRLKQTLDPQSSALSAVADRVEWVCAHAKLPPWRLALPPAAEASPVTGEHSSSATHSTDAGAS
jgi:hypothetical protein